MAKKEYMFPFVTVVECEQSEDDRARSDRRWSRPRSPSDARRFEQRAARRPQRRSAQPRSDPDDQAQLAPAARGQHRRLPLPAAGVPEALPRSRRGRGCSPCSKSAISRRQYPTTRGPLPILTDVSLSLSRGDAASIMGPSGSGKSTLLYIIGALEPPTSGTVRLERCADPFMPSANAKLAGFRNTQGRIRFSGSPAAPAVHRARECVDADACRADPSLGCHETGRCRLIEHVGLQG